MKIASSKAVWGAVSLGILLSLSWPCGAVEWEKLGKLNDQWKITGSLRTRNEVWHWFDPGDPRRLGCPAGDPVCENDNNSYNFTALQLRLGLKYQSDPLEGLVEVQDTRLLGLPSDAGAPVPPKVSRPLGPLGLGAVYFAHNRDQDQGETFVKQAYLHWKGLGKSLGVPGLSLKAGRFEYLDGLEVLTGEPTLDWLKRVRISQRLIGPFGWSHVTRSFDGFQLAYDAPLYNFTFFLSRPTQGGFEIAANKEISDIDLLSAALTLKRSLLPGEFEGRLFYMFYGDDREISKTDNNQKLTTPALRDAERRRDIDLSTFGMHLVGTREAGPGKAEVLFWGSLQGGEWGGLRQRGWAWAVEAGYQLPKLSFRPWVRAGYFASSGDDNPFDSLHKTFFQMIPTGRPYAQFPFFNQMNNRDLFVQLLGSWPARGISARIDFRRLWLSERDDRWYMGSGATQVGGAGKVFGYIPRPSFGSRDLATLADISLSCDLSKILNVNLYYGHAFGGGVISRIYREDDGDFAYLELQLKF